MPALPFAPGIAGFIGAVIVPLVLKLLASLGIGIMVYTGTNLLLDGTLAMIESQFQMPPGFENVVNLLAFMNVDKAITIIFSAVVVRFTLAGMSAAGGLKKWGTPG